MVGIFYGTQFLGVIINKLFEVSLHEKCDQSPLFAFPVTSYILLSVELFIFFLSISVFLSYFPRKICLKHFLE